MTSRMLSILALVTVLFGAGAARAQDRPAIVVTPGAATTFRAAVQDFADFSAVPDAKRTQEFRATLEEALAFSGIFKALSHEAFLGPVKTPALDGDEPVVCPDWTQIGADALVEGEIRADTDFSVEYRVWDVSRCVRLERKRYRQASSADAGLLARRIADDVVAAFIGTRGVAGTEIAFVSTRGKGPEIYVMGADGSNQRRATNNGSINKFPAWSPEGDSILYTSYRQSNRPMLFLSSRGRGRPGRLLRRMNGDFAEYRGVFSPLGDTLAVVLSEPDRESDIYSVRRDGSKLKPLTRNRSIDIGPAWSPDATRIAFVSDRSGSPQIYVMDADGSNQKRLTFQGSYNTHPAWSPDGRWIAYETRVGGQFDIWLIDPEATVNVPLVTHPRSDESPAWSPNSRKLAFSSKRRGSADIYVVDVNGENPRRITSSRGEDTAPSWGPFPR
jgi:TolB protein